MVSLHLFTTLLSAFLFFALTAALPTPSTNIILSAREEYSEYENFLRQWLEKQGQSLGKEGDKIKRSQMAFRKYEDTYGDLLADRLKRLGNAG